MKCTGTLSLPQGDEAKEVVSAPTAIGRRLTTDLTYAGTTESIVLLEEPETLDAELLQEEEAEAKAEAEKTRPGLTMFTDGPDWMAERSNMRWYGKTTSAGWESKPTWDTTRRPMIRSALHSPGCWRLRREDK